jgi:photosystem II stability/assembly factor-like uncharacterized protein
MKTTTMLIISTLLIRTLGFSQWAQVYDNPDVNGFCYAKSKDSCFVAGLNGKIFRTINGGVSWDSVQTVFKTSWFLDIKFTSKSIGYACGGTAFGQHKSVIAKTTNGGVTWDSIASDLYGYNLYSGYFLNNNTGFFAGEGHILKTTDGGATFSIQLLPVAAIYDFFFTTPTTGFFAGASEIRKTTDMGQTWSVVYTDTTYVNSICFTNATTGFAVGNKGSLLKTTDGGNTWSKTLIAPDSVFLRSIEFLNTTTGYIVASKYQVADQGYIYKTTDGGVTWIQQMMTNVALTGISMTNIGEGYAAGYRKVFRIVGNTTGIIGPGSVDAGFRIYPVPACNTLKLECSESVKGGSLHIRDAKGDLVLEIRIENDVDATIENLQNGFYNVILFDRSGIIRGSEKIVIGR